MQETNQALVRRWFREVWNEGREATIDELFAQSCVAYGLGEEKPKSTGRRSSNLRSQPSRQLPGLHIGIQDIMAEDDKVMVRVLLEGTHSGPGLGVEPTGRRIHVAGIVVIRISNGQFVEGWNSWDSSVFFAKSAPCPVQKAKTSFWMRVPDRCHGPFSRC